MDLQTLRFFRTVAEEGSYSAAAQKLRYAQSNLSNRIIQLEKEYNVLLFQRHKSGVTLTEKGALLFNYAVRILDLCDEMQKAVKDNGHIDGVLTLGSMESMAVSVLPEMLSEYHKSFPNSEIIIRTGTTASLIKALERHELDGVFIAGQINNEDFITIPVWREELALISSISQKEQCLSSLLNKPLLVFPIGCSYRQILEELAAIRNTIEFTSLGAIIASVSAGLGVSLFPKSAIGIYREKQEFALYTLPESLRWINIYFVYRNNEYLTHSLKNFITAHCKMNVQ